jgi:hypothetical protein
MKSFKVTFDKGLLKGLRQFETNPLNQESLVVCFNLAPSDKGLEGHEVMTDLNSTGDTWGGEGKFALDYIDEDVIITDEVVF